MQQLSENSIKENSDQKNHIIESQAGGSADPQRPF
jgi:hypothetical protein